MEHKHLKFIIDLALWSLALPLAYLLRLEGQIGSWAADVALATALAVPVKALCIYYMRWNYQGWRKSGIWDLIRIIQGVSAVAVLMLLASLFLPMLFIPRSVPVIEAALAVLLLSGVRLSARMIYESSLRGEVTRSSRRVDRVLVAGAGEAGTMLAREVNRRPDSFMQIVGFLDDHVSKQKKWFLGYPVLGSLDELQEVAREHRIDKVVIAMPTVPGSVIRRVVDACRETRVSSQIMPGLYDLLSGKFRISQLRDVHVEDLLRREEVKLDLAPISEYLKDRTVLVTGAGGSIGREIVRQITAFYPQHILLLGRGENSIYEVERSCQAHYPQIRFTPLITDVRDRASLEHHFQTHHPEVIFHAAAHKHVPLMESNPEQAVLNNVQGTRNVAELALKYGVERMVNVSSDKSVNPTSVMGCSKRIAELIVEWVSLQARKHQTFVSVRFGNVLGSRGSVIPMFTKQIRNGGPVTITHPEMTRYFMTIPEASRLVLQAGGLGGNGSVYVLDMGQPIKIVDLARDLIRLSGLSDPDDIEITYTGVRPGEKLFEELLTSEEETTATHHSKIFVARSSGLPAERFEESIEALLKSAQHKDAEAIRRQMKKIVPTYVYAEQVSSGAGKQPAAGSSIGSP